MSALTPLSEKTERFLKRIYKEYGQRTEKQKQRDGEYFVSFMIGYIDKVYYTLDEIQKHTDELKETGYLRWFVSPDRENGLATFTPEGLEYCRKTYTEQ